MRALGGEALHARMCRIRVHEEDALPALMCLGAGKEWGVVGAVKEKVHRKQAAALVAEERGGGMG